MLFHWLKIHFHCKMKKQLSYNLELNCGQCRSEIRLHGLYSLILIVVIGRERLNLLLALKSFESGQINPLPDVQIESIWRQQKFVTEKQKSFVGWIENIAEKGEKVKFWVPLAKSFLDDFCMMGRKHCGKTRKCQILSHIGFVFCKCFQCEQAMNFVYW